MTNFDFTQPHKIVNGEPVLLTAEEIAAQSTIEQEWVASANARVKAALQIQIDDLERSSLMPRALRDQLLASSSLNANARTEIQSLDDQIKTLRTQYNSL